ncbi:MAG: response regulator [Gemmatimonadota bacterium]
MNAGDPRRILVIEDDPEIRHLLGVVLAAPDREILQAETVEEANARMRDTAPDLVLLDLILPDDDGRAVLRNLKRDPARADIPVIVLTVKDSPEVRAECFALGAESFISKPFDPEALAEEVHVRLEREAARERAALTDRLTGLRNRAGLLVDLRSEPALDTLVYVSLDGYEELQQKWGWGTAERMEHMAAQRLAEILRHVGDGIGALSRPFPGAAAVPVQGAERAAEVAENLLEGVRTLSVEDPEGEPFRLTASVAVVSRRDGEEPEDLLIRAREAADKVAQAGGNRFGGEEDEAAAGALRIVVADDDDITAQILVHRLEKEGFAVERLDNGQAAYERILEEVPALVILDVKMPGLDGFEVLQRLRKTPALDRVPIIMVTSMGKEGDIVRGFDLGADDYIQKPFSPTELVARVRRLIRRGHVPDAA